MDIFQFDGQVSEEDYVETHQATINIRRKSAPWTISTLFLPILYVALSYVF